MLDTSPAATSDAPPRGAFTVALGDVLPAPAPPASQPPAVDDAPVTIAASDVGRLDPLEPGTILGHFKILSVLGRGGFGITYRARDGHNAREVAVKEFFPAGCVRRVEGTDWRIEAGPSLGESAFGIARAQFVEGARALAKFRHPSLARVWEHFEAHGTAYLVMELLEGRTLLECATECGPLDEAGAVHLAHALGEAAATMHRLDFLHLDIKPENVMLCPTASTSGAPSTCDGWGDVERSRVVLFDFDLLQRIEKETGLHTRPLTAHCGTPGYAPLEQYAQQAALGPFSDLYALGATLFHALSAHDPPAAVDRALSNQVLDVRAWRPDVSEEVAGAIAWAMEMSPNARPQSVEAWLPSLKDGRPKSAVKKTKRLDLDNASDADFLSYAPIAPTLGGAAPTSSAAILAGASLNGAPSLPATPALPALPIVDNWHQLSAKELDFEWPYSCACCGRKPDLALPVRAAKSKWGVPYCARCSRHIKAAHQASAGTAWGIVIGLVVATIGWAMSDFWIGPIGVAIHFSALTYGALKVQAAESLMRPRCCDRKHAVGFGGERHTRSGRKYLVRFRSLQYAHEWKAKNASKL